ncbi:MAG: hypothetical protein J07HX64_03053 [halophilic archaeon J07HX64]|nr:MAG: hypothetical protein J07HX64_03053 [halophilic archaeon J07HX64]
MEGSTQSERGGDDTDSEPELTGFGSGDVRLDEPTADRKRLVIGGRVAKHRVDRDTEHQRREQVEQPGEDTRNDTDDSLELVGSPVRTKQAFHRVLYPVPLVLEGVIILPIDRRHSSRERAAHKKGLSLSPVTGGHRWGYRPLWCPCRETPLGDDPGRSCTDESEGSAAAGALDLGPE